MRQDMMSEQYAELLKKRPGCFFNQVKTLLIMDMARSHKGEMVDSALKKLNIKAKYIDSGMTPLLQFLDTHVNKPFKDYMKERWADWLENGEKEFTKLEKEEEHPTKWWLNGFVIPGKRYPTIWSSMDSSSVATFIGMGV